MEITKPNLKKVIKAIKEGKVIICPTDTVYGLICDAGNKEAVARLYKIKKRPKNKLIPIFVSDIKMAKKLAEINPRQEKFLKRVWPGPVTAVFHYKKPGIRIPNYKFVLDLVKHTGPLAETSANISGQPASTKIKEVIKQFEGKRHQPDLAVDAGNLKKAKPSKVIDLTIWPPKILRY
ncbi:MAG: threonylcarbamoyl-AMP synthase [Candidatus Nealsonbacteria bacterium]|nr:threonylcarbamoyl-AMP synthase [Candidatus Nealsonbacteria bacterium]